MPVDFEIRVLRSLTESVLWTDKGRVTEGLSDLIVMVIVGSASGDQLVCNLRNIGEKAHPEREEHRRPSRLEGLRSLSVMSYRSVSLVLQDEEEGRTARTLILRGRSSRGAT